MTWNGITNVYVYSHPEHSYFGLYFPTDVLNSVSQHWGMTTLKENTTWSIRTLNLFPSRNSLPVNENYIPIFSHALDRFHFSPRFIWTHLPNLVTGKFPVEQEHLTTHQHCGVGNAWPSPVHIYLTFSIWTFPTSADFTVVGCLPLYPIWLKDVHLSSGALTVFLSSFTTKHLPV